MFTFILPFLAFGLAFAITSLLLPEIIKIANRYGLQDVPNARKVHAHKIPTFGGMAIFFGFVMASLLSTFADLDTTIQYFLCGILVVVVIGMRDDFLALAAKWKFLGQLLAAFLLVHFGEMRLLNINGLFGLHALPFVLDYGLSLFIIVGITNAFNLIDGVNGLAGTVSLVVLSFLGAWFFWADVLVLSIFCFSLVGGIIAFLRFNYTPARIFMGDTGSLLLGFTISGMIFLFLRHNASSQIFGAAHVPSFISAGLVLILYPAFDTLRVFVLRIWEGRSPFSADQNHIHHLLLRLGLSHMQVTGLIVSVQVILITIFLILSKWGVNENYLVASMVFTVLVVVGLLQLFHNRKYRYTKSSVKHA